QDLEAIVESGASHLGRVERLVLAEGGNLRAVDRRLARPSRDFGTEPEHQPTGHIEPARHRLLHRLRRQRRVALEVPLESPRVAEESVVLIEQVGLAAESTYRLETGDERELVLDSRAGELGGRRPLL